MDEKDRKKLEEALMDLRSIDSPTQWDNYIDSAIKNISEVLEVKK